MTKILKSNEYNKLDEGLSIKPVTKTRLAKYKETVGKTIVTFRYDEDNDEVVAVFPYIENNDGTIMCYSHIGQHSSCVWDWVEEDTIPATKEQYADLLKELEDQGYDDLLIEDEIFNESLCVSEKLTIQPITKGRLTNIKNNKLYNKENEDAFREIIEKILQGNDVPILSDFANDIFVFNFGFNAEDESNTYISATTVAHMGYDPIELPQEVYNKYHIGNEITENEVKRFLEYGIVFSTNTERILRIENTFLTLLSDFTRKNAKKYFGFMPIKCDLCDDEGGMDYFQVNYSNLIHGDFKTFATKFISSVFMVLDDFCKEMLDYVFKK